MSSGDPCPRLYLQETDIIGHSGERNEAEECMLVTKLDYSEDYLQLQDMKYVHSDIQ